MSTNTANPAFPPFKVGDYAMHHMDGADRGTLVLICDRNDRGNFGVEYVSNNGDSGGSSYSWPPKDFRAITDPRLWALSRVHYFAREAKLATARAESHKHEAAVWRSAVSAIDAAFEHCGSKT